MALIALFAKIDFTCTAVAIVYPYFCCILHLSIASPLCVGCWFITGLPPPPLPHQYILYVSSAHLYIWLKRIKGRASFLSKGTTSGVIINQILD